MQKVTCEACGRFFVKGEPVCHHWFEGVDRVRRSAEVCFCCNNVLRRPKHDPERYLLPCLKTQKWYARHVQVGDRPVQRLDELAQDELAMPDGLFQSVRLPNELARRAKANADRKGITLSEYLRGLVVRELGRKR